MSAWSVMDGRTPVATLEMGGPGNVIIVAANHPSGAEVATWATACPTLEGKEDEVGIFEMPTTVPPSDPLWGLAFLDAVEERGWTVLELEALAEFRALWPDKTGHDDHGRGPGSGGGYPTGLTKVSGPKGSNPGGVYQDESGQKWYVKEYKDADQAAGEHAANAVYSAIGVDSADSRISEDGKKIALRWQDGTILNKHGLDKETADRVLDGFAGDVFLQNWDAVGTGHDNVLVKPGGQVMRIDQGGTLLHRAQGAPKPEAGRHEIGEWESLRNMNPYYGEVFKRAGVKSGDALGERAAKQIDKIVAGRPAAGWESLIRQAAPAASEGYKKKAGAMLEARQKKLEAKRDQLRGRSLENPYHHPAGSSQGGEFAPKPGGGGDSDLVIVKKAKAPHATKDQIAKAVQLKAEGKSYAEIEKETGLNPKQAATIVFKHNKAQKAAVKAIDPDDLLNPLNNPHLKNVVPTVEQFAAKGYAYDKKYGAWTNDYGKTFVPGPVPQGVDQLKKAGLTFVPGPPGFEAQEGKWESKKPSIPNPAGIPGLETAGPPKSNAPTFETNPLMAQGELLKKGYDWKEKTTGPAKGKYAFFKDGVQVSANAPKDEMAKAAATINFGKGPDYVAPPPPPVLPVPGKIGGSQGLIADKIETVAPPVHWPITDDTTRMQGSTYPKKMDAQGQAWSKTLTVDEHDAVRSYTGSGSGSVNKPLIAGDKLSSKAKLIDSALAKSPKPPPPELVWRRINIGTPESVLSSLEAGDVIKLKGFQSTSISPTAWSGNLIFEIKPTAGAYVKTVSSHKGEAEYLLPHGAHYVVRGVRTVAMGSTGYKQKVLQLEMQPLGSKP